MSESQEQLREIVESLLFTANRALEAEELAKLIRKGGTAAAEGDESEALAKVTLEDIDSAVDQLQQRLEGTAVMVQSVSKGYRMATRPEYEFWAALPYESNVKPTRLSQPALETLAVIAYRQPISRAEIEAVRGVAVGGVLETLVDRGVVRVAGRADVPGRPLLYETTPYFLEHFGIKELEDLPNSEELKRVPLPQPEDPDSDSQQELIQDELASEGTVEETTDATATVKAEEKELPEDAGEVTLEEPAAESVEDIQDSQDVDASSESEERKNEPSENS